ncbi:MAG: ParB/RepB/Spo0J family partition protein [Rhodospirillaceae bacterium]|nr:ParB/RepB/Spo0J family partition protein [Rhodospirillaceae bacterium]
MVEKRNLGRGLAALFGNMVEGEETSSPSFLLLAHDVLQPSTLQPRRTFLPEQLNELAGSIRQDGILQPLLVRKHPNLAGQYEIIAGERRWRAAKIAALKEVPVVIKEMNDQEVLQIALVENLQRQDLLPLEEAEAYHRLLHEFGKKQEEIAEMVGKSRSHIANLMRLLDLPAEIKELLTRGDLSAGHARALLNAKDPVRLARQVIAEDLSVRETEELSRKNHKALKNIAANRWQNRQSEIIALEKDLSTLLGAKARITLHGNGGMLTLRYKTLQELEAILHRLQAQKK